jgi:hypothetical protein
MKEIRITIMDDQVADDMFYFLDYELKQHPDTYDGSGLSIRDCTLDEIRMHEVFKQRALTED